MSDSPLLISQLTGVFPRAGRVEWIGLRAGRRQALEPVESVAASCESGLEGDHYSGRSGKRQVTLIDGAHLAAAAAYLGLDAPVAPELVRRNLVVSGLNLLALKEQRFRVGGVVLEYTVPCHPCSRMEQNLGPGGYNAMRGHGGICARVIEPGVIALGDEVRVL